MPKKFLNQFLVGCDPEFILVDATGHVMHVERYIPHDGPVGWDHEGRVLEVRPAPARGTYTLIKRLRSLLLENAARAGLPEARRWRAGAHFNRECLGGHIHLDVPFNGPQVKEQIGALDAFTAALEALDVLPARECLARRASGRYGNYGNVRQADDAPRLEYRTMPSWLFHPVPAFLCLTGAKLATLAPVETCAALAAPTLPKLRAFFELFANRDQNAKRVVEKVFGPELLLQYDPDADIRETWRALPY